MYPMHLSLLNTSKDEGIRTEWHSKDSVRQPKTPSDPLLFANVDKESERGPTTRPPPTSNLARAEADRRIDNTARSD
jgi:hypothetical protein